jgi:hypothetical protein
MSDEHIQPVGNGGYEHEDLTAKSIYGFLVGLVVLGLVVYFAVNGIYWGLEKYSGAHQPQQNPMKQTAETDTRDTNTAKVQREITSTFPEPRLETDERNELTEPRMREEEHLNSYGYVDQAAGTLHIPIDRAMQLVAERGLPVRPQNAAAAAPKDSVSKGKEAAGSGTQ